MTLLTWPQLHVAVVVVAVVVVVGPVVVVVVWDGVVAVIGVVSKNLCYEDQMSGNLNLLLTNLLW